jgi:tetratricopeptide (TPR) repeat protein
MRSPLIIGCVVVAAVRIVHAGPNDAKTDNAAKAELMFEEGQKLKAENKLQEACAKFDEALALNPNAVGTILNVALCDEQAGKVASAAKLFAEARDRAREQNLDEHRKAAEDHYNKLEPRLPHLAIAFAEAPTAETKLVIDDQIVPISTASDIPIDPGSRKIVVTAPGRVAYETKIDIVEKEHKAVAIPKLGHPVTVKRTRTTVGKLLTFGGAGLIATGVVIGLAARSSYNQPFNNDPSNKVYCAKATAGMSAMCSGEGYAQTRDARTLGNVGTAVSIVGVAAAGVGMYLWLFAPSETSEKLAIVPTIGPDQTGIAAIGRF